MRVSTAERETDRGWGGGGGAAAHTHKTYTLTHMYHEVHTDLSYMDVN